MQGRILQQYTHIVKNSNTAEYASLQYPKGLRLKHNLANRQSFVILLYNCSFANSQSYALTLTLSYSLQISIPRELNKPYISGSLYNQHNPSLATLPTQDHITALSSKTIGVNEQGSNEITLSNEKNKEEITLKAQKDYTQSINHNFSQTIKNNKDSITLGNYTESIHKAHMQTITLAKNVNIGGEYLTNVALSKDTIVGLSNTLNVGVDNKLRVAKDSSESIGGDRRVEIGGNSREEIEGDKHIIIKGERQEHIEGSLTQNVAKDIDIFAANNHTITTHSSIFFNADENTTLESKKTSNLAF